ncbi:MAG TPA: carboxylate-amine ligase [Longimicrobiales bacterium]|nr:carboxylate-amine ligase [Longimicrobiales bacterium]
MKRPSLTLGVEEEYQVVDPETRMLHPYIMRVLDKGRITVKGIKPELHQSTVEVGTEVCANTSEVRSEIVRLRRAVSDLAGEYGWNIVSSGTHPVSSWTESPITPVDRYLGLEEDLQDLARRNLIFGTHVHVGVEDREFLIDTMKVARYFLPHLLALSASSPFWMGRNTGLMSYRTVVWRPFPRSGMPPAFETWADYEHLVSTLVRANSMEDPSKIWWDIRPSHFYPTLEFRICDMGTRVDEVVCLAALVQAIVAKLWRLRRENVTFRCYSVALLQENKFRAARWGLDGNLIDLGKGEEVSTREMVLELLAFVDDVLDELGSREDVAYARQILSEGSSAHRQIRILEETGDMNAVVDHLIAETMEGVP